MGVAEQMLLNQVTIFNPTSSQPIGYSSTHCGSSSGYKHKSTEELRQQSAREELRHLFGDDETTSRYAFGWSNPYELYKEKND